MSTGWWSSVMPDSFLKSSHGNALGIGLALFSGIFVLLAVLLYIFQSKLIYLPQMPPGSREEVWKPSRFGYGPARSMQQEKETSGTWEEVEIITKDGKKLHAFWIDAPSIWNKNDNANTSENTSDSSPFTIIYFQANAGNIGHRIPIARKLQESIDCNVLLLSYRGYGESEGTPSESGIKIDSQAALDYVWNEKIKSFAERSKIVIYGQSIGGAVAIHLTATNPDKIRFLIVENTFTSIPSLIPRVAPILGPFAFLCNQKWHSSEAIPRISARILFLAGDCDELIPPDHMIQLHRLAVRATIKRLIRFENGTHNDTCIQKGYFEAIQDFLLIKAPKTPRVTVEEVTDDEANPKQQLLAKPTHVTNKTKKRHTNNNNNNNRKNK